MRRRLVDLLRERIPRLLLRRHHINDPRFPGSVQTTSLISGVDARLHDIFRETLRPQLLAIQPRGDRSCATLCVVTHGLDRREQLSLYEACKSVRARANLLVTFVGQHVDRRATRDFRGRGAERQSRLLIRTHRGEWTEWSELDRARWFLSRGAACARNTVKHRTES